MKTLIKILSLILIAFIHVSSGMFECILMQFEPLVKNSSLLNLDKIKFTRFNRTTTVVNGSVVFNYNGSVHDADVLCDIFKKAGNDYKLSPYKIPRKNLCSAMIEDDYFYSEFHAHTNFPKLKSCDFEIGKTYYVKNYLPDLSKVPPVMASGDYKVECKVFMGEEFLQGTRTFAQVYNIVNAG